MFFHHEDDQNCHISNQNLLPISYSDLLSSRSPRTFYDDLFSSQLVLQLYWYTGLVCTSSRNFAFSQFFLNKIWPIIYLHEIIISFLNYFPTCPLRQRRFLFSTEQMASTSLTAHYNLKVNIGWGSNKFLV